MKDSAVARLFREMEIEVALVGHLPRRELIHCEPLYNGKEFFQHAMPNNMRRQRIRRWRLPAWRYGHQGWERLWLIGRELVWVGPNTFDPVWRRVYLWM